MRTGKGLKKNGPGIIKKKLFKLSLTLACGAAVFFLVFKAGNLVASIVFPVKDNIKISVLEGEIEPGGSLYTALTPLFSSAQAVDLGNCLAEIYNPRNVRAGHKYRIYHSTSGRILKFEYYPEPLKNYVVSLEGDRFSACEVIPEYEVKRSAVKGTIDSSLYVNMRDSGVDVKTIMAFAEIFQWQVDFFTEVWPGDRFLIVYDRYFLNGEAVESGNIIAASYRGRPGNHTAIRFKDGKNTSYFDAEGDSLRKQFLKAPLNYTRISSRYNPRRMHPILRYVRPHLAIDYAAPSGTPISSVAAGRVIYSGWKGGYGRTVVVKHNSVYITQYGHMRSYARGMKVGKYVQQGEVIGYVGASGVATGPHLDFKITRYGKPVNYLSLKFPPTKSVSGDNMEEFKKEVDKVREYLDIMQSDYFIGEPAVISDFEQES